MTDERVVSTIRSMCDAAALARQEEATRTTFTKAFGRLICVSYPARADIEPINLDASLVAARGDQSFGYRVTLIDGASVRSSLSIDWPQQWLGPLGALSPEHAGDWPFAVDNETKSLIAFSPEKRESIVWCRDVSRLPYWARATPFRIPLSWIAHTFGGEMIHGAGVVFGDQAVLLLGPGGAGKSTLALAAAQSGLPLLGDDFLMVSGLEAQAIYRRVKAHDETLERLAGGPSIGAILNADAPGEKRILDLDPGLLHADPISIGALVVPRIGVRATSTRMAAPEVLRRVLYPSMQGLLGGSGMTLKVLAQVARHLPAYELEVGPDVQDNVAALTAIAEESRETRSSTWVQQDSA